MINPNNFDKKFTGHRTFDFNLEAGKLAITKGNIYQYEDIVRQHQPTFLELEQQRGTTIVDMNQAGYVEAAIGERQRIATFWLGGCTAVGVVATFPDGHRRAHVQHYDPFAKRMDPATREFRRSNSERGSNSR